MKKIIAILFLIVTLFASTHATLIYHFCGGNLYSVDFISTKITSCCEEVPAEITSCCGEKKHPSSHSEKNTIQNIPCCSNYYLTVCTDDFTTVQQIAIAGTVNDFLPVALISSQIFGLDDVCTAKIIQHAFPPPGITVKSGIDLLLSICTLII